MSSDEEKEAGQEPTDNEAAEPALIDQGADAQLPAEPEPMDQEPVEEGSVQEKKEKRFWLLSLGFTLLLLAAGGYYALTGMRQTAHKLGGGSDYDQLSANSSIYDGGTGSARNADYFPLDEDAARRAAVGGAKSDRVNPALARAGKELAAESSGAVDGAAPAAAARQEAEPSSAESQRAASAGGQTLMAEKLQARASLGGAMGAGSARSSAAGPAGSAAAFQGGGTAVGKAAEQRQTNPGMVKKAGRGSVMESLKGAFKATFYGARLSSQDSAKSWIARAFDGSPEATTAIEYDDNMRSKLDKVNPDSIPNFLREQDVSAAEAKSLSASDVAKPKIDKAGTKDALEEDKNYQAKKLAKDFSGSMINGLFAGVSGTGSPGNEDPGRAVPGEDGPDALDFADPEDVQDITDEELKGWVQDNGYGAECGCTEAAPCCCMPNSGPAGDAGISGGSRLWAGPDTVDISAGGGTAFA